MPTGNKKRRINKFATQGGICHWCKKPMTLDRGMAGRPVKNFATFEHLLRKRDGGRGKPNNVVLACYQCNHGREVGIKTSPPKIENLAAQRAPSSILLQRLSSGEISQQERGELYTRGILPNWPMWSRLMAAVPPGDP